MLHLAMIQLSTRYDQLRVLSIDPGLNNIGLAELIINTSPLQIVSIAPATLTEDRVVDDITLDSQNAMERDAKRLRMVNALMKHVINFTPDKIVCESPFFNPTRPSSFVVLVEVISEIRDRIRDYDPAISFNMIAPKEAKKTLGVADQKGKDPIREAVANHPYLSSLLTIPLESVTEHAIDAVVIGFTFFNYLSRGE